MTPELIAESLLTPIWRGIPADYKSKYRQNIWQQFEDNIRSAAYTSRLQTWLDTICRRLNVTIRPEHAAQMMPLFTMSMDRAILRALRDETTLLVLLVRVANEERKAEQQQASMF